MFRDRFFQRLPAVAAVLLAFPLSGCVDDATPTALDANVLLDVQAQDAQVEYEAVILTPDYERSTPNAINSQGTVIGSAQPEGTSGQPVLTLFWLWRDGELVEGPSEAWAAGINIAGNVVGSMDGNPVLWTDPAKDGFVNPIVLGTAGGEGGGARHINDLGNIAGSDSGQNLFWPDSDASPIKLDSPDGYDRHGPSGLNNAGYVTSHASRRSEDGLEEVALVWRAKEGTESVTPLILPHLDGALRSAASAINEEGDVVGYGVPRGDIRTGPRRQAVLWRYEGDGVWRDPINLAPSSDDTRWASGITSQDGGIVRVVGYTSTNRGSRAVVWMVDAADNVQMQVLPFPAGFHQNRSTSWAMAISDEGWIVGIARDHNADHHIAVLWRPAGPQHDNGDDDDDDDDNDDDDGPCHHNPRHPCHG